MDILAHAQELIYHLLDVMPTPYQRQSLQALLAVFLRAWVLLYQSTVS